MENRMLRGVFILSTILATPLEHPRNRTRSSPASNPLNRDQRPQHSEVALPARRSGRIYVTDTTFSRKLLSDAKDNRQQKNESFLHRISPSCPHFCRDSRKSLERNSFYILKFYLLISHLRASARSGSAPLCSTGIDQRRRRQ